MSKCPRMFVATALAAMMACHPVQANAGTDGLTQVEQALREGRADEALMMLSAEIEGRAHSPGHRARALYNRARAHLATNKPALAAADAKAALWLQALPPAEAADADLIQSEAEADEDSTAPPKQSIAPVEPLAIKAQAGHRPVI